MRILVVEDDKRIAALIERAFRDGGHSVTLVYDGRDGNPNNNLWVAYTPSNTQTWGLTYQQKYLDFGILDKRVGPM